MWSDDQVCQGHDGKAVVLEAIKCILAAAAHEF